MTRFGVFVCAVTIMLVAITASCSSSSPAESASPPTTTSSNAPATSQTPEAPEFQQLDKKALTSALLELDSLPAGWSEDTSSSGSNKSTYCGAKPSKADIIVQRAFEKGGGLSTEIASVGLSQYSSADEASSQFEKFRDGMKDCKSEKVDGDTVKYAVVNTEDVGYPSFGFKVTAESYGVIINVSQVGPTLVQVGSGGIVNTDADLAGDLLQEQVDSYTTAAR